MNKSRGLLLYLMILTVISLNTATVWATETYQYITKWGVYGSFNGQFTYPNGVAVDASGNVYVVDRDINRIQKFSSTGTFITKWGGYGTGDGDLYSPSGIAVDTTGNVYVVDTGHNRIQKFSSTGTYLAQWGAFGTGNKQFDTPQGVAVDASGNIYIADTGNNRIQKLDSAGTFITKWGAPGSGNSQFDYPLGIAVDASGNVYVVDWNNRVQKFSSTGTYLTQWGVYGSGDGEFVFPSGVAVDALGNVYVSDTENDRVQKFSSTGTFITKWGTSGTGNGQFDYPLGIAAGASGAVYVADAWNFVIQKFAPVLTPGTVTVASLQYGSFVGSPFNLQTTFTSASNVSSCEYTTNGTTWNPATVIGAIPNFTCNTWIGGTNGQVFTLNMRATSSGGATGTATGITRTVDAEVPITTDDSTSTWTQISPVTVTLTPTDGAGSGVAETRYCVDTTGTCTPTIAGTAVSVTCAAGSACVQYVRYYSVDNVGNREDVDEDGEDTVKTSNQIRQNLMPPNAPVVTGTTPTTDTTPTWSWTSGGGGGNGTYRYKLDSSDLNTGATQTTALSFTPISPLSIGGHTLYAQERDTAGNWSNSGSFTITINTVQYALSVSKTGTGTGTVASSPAGISCGGTCSFSFNQATLVTLTPTPNSNSVFTGWSGACAGAGTCQVTMNSIKSVTANFTVKATITWNLVSGVRETCVNSASALATALYEAGTDGYPNLIKVVQGTYIGLFAYSGNENFDLNLEGGYVPGCATFSYNPELTILNGDITGSDNIGDGVVLDLITLNPSGTGNINVEGFHVKNGHNGIDDGGCIRVFTAIGSATLTGNVVSRSSAVDGGGIGVETFGGNILLTNNIVYGNAATTNGGGIGAVSASGTITILNNTITGNTGNGGGGVAVGLGTTAHADIQNNIILGNTGTIPDVAIDTLYYQAPPVNQTVPGTFLFDYNDAVVANIVTNPAGVVSVGHNINGTDPQFMDTVNKNYHLQTTSPVIDLGNSAHALLPTVDIDGDNRIIGTAVDIGADEVVPLPGAPIVTATTPTKDTTPTWTWISGGGGNGTFRYRLDNPVLTTGAITTTLKSFTPATALANGSHTLYVQEKNAAGLWSATNGSNTVLIDTTLPINGTLTAAPGLGDIALTWAGFSDGTGSGIEKYKLVYAPTTAPANCSTGTILYEGPATSYTHTGLSNLTYGYRVCAIDNAGNISTGAIKTAKPLPSENNSPTGGVTINNGDTYTKSATVTLTLSAADASLPIQMCISNTTSCTTWIAYASTKSWILLTGNGLKTVYVKYRDTWGNTTPDPSTDTITLDTTAPVNGTLTATPEAGQIALDWSIGFSDGTGSGIEKYKLVYAPTTAPANCSTGTILYEGPATSYTHTGLSNLTYGYRVCAIDNAGNISTGAIKTAKPLPSENNSPTGGVTINNGDTYTKSATVTLTLSAADASLPIQMCISNTTSCTTWIAYASTKSWILLTGNGLKTVYVKYRDTWGNTTPDPSTDTITLDTTAPVNGTLTATPEAGQIALDWSIGFSDGTGSGIEKYKLVYAPTTAPANCSTGTILYEGPATSYTHTGLSNLTYGYRVCAIDNAGNISTGAIKTAKPLPSENNSPTGGVTINNGDTYTKSATVTLTLSAADASLPIQMCISNTTSCTTWIAYASTKSWILLTGNGLKTVYVKYRDTWGNTTPDPSTDTITLDTTAPVNGTLTATPEAGQIALDWSIGFSDGTGSGIEKYKLVYAPTTAPANCSTGTILYEGPATSYTHTGLSNLTYGYRVCAIDNAGNISTGAIKTAKPLPSENNSPTGGVTINNGDTYTKSATVTLTLSAADASLPIQMCISNTTSCTTWIAYASTKSWILLTGNGLKTVYVKYRDTWGNTTPDPSTDTITLDITAPVNGTLTATPEAGQIALDWSIGFSDGTGSGIEKYKLVYAPTTAPANCSTGTILYEGPATSYTHTGLSNLTYGYRVCAIDNAGNTSTGATKSAKPL